MITQKIRKPEKRYIIIIAFIAFFIGNRLSFLYLEAEGNPIIAIMHSVEAFLPSLAFSYLGFSVSMKPICLLTGFFITIISEAIYFYYMTMRKNYKIGEEHGSARYGTPDEAKTLKDEDENENIILSQNIYLSSDTRKTFLNDNIMLIGGSGSGKTRYVVKPNLLQLSGNIICTDPKGRTLIETGNAFLTQGYDIKILNVNHMESSMRYNPFHYCKNANDIMKLLNNLMDNTSDPNRKSPDEFWDKAGLTLLMALSFLIMGTDLPENKNIPRLMELLDLADASEEDENAKSVLDYVFEELQEEVDAKLKSGNHKLVIACKNSYEYLACRQYTLYKKAAGKTAKSILVTLGAKLSIFNLPEVDNLLSSDELQLETIGSPKIRKGKENAPDDDPEKYIKTAFFVCISDSDSTFTFLAAIVYQQLFDLLYHQADTNEGGRLPVHVYALLDEFANIGKIPDFERKIATMRSREISVMVILQNLSQLKSMYQNEVWETIYGNCDSTIFLGGKEFSTLEYLSKNIGNTTIDYMSISETKGSNGSWSKSNQLIQRALLPPDEIKRLKADECLIDIRGHYIFRDKKYNLLSHPNYHLTADADKNNLFLLQKYIEHQKEEGILNNYWTPDLNNYSSSLEETEAIDFSLEALEFYDNNISA